MNKAVYTDMDALKIIMQNILETSIKLTEIGSINIELSNPDPELIKKAGIKPIKNANEASYLLISIIDNGIGLQENETEGILNHTHSSIK